MKFELHSKPYRIDDLEFILQSLPAIPFIKNGKTQVANIPCAFDIETTSFYEDGEKRACMYVWQFGFGGYVIMGRTWGEFVHLCELLSDRFKLNEERKIICYIHNMMFEFQFMRHLFQWVKVFSLEKRRPIYGLTTLGIEFRCSYILSGFSLEKLGGQLQKYKVDKLVGDLDYSLMRHSGTELSEQEIDYCVNDVLVVMAYIQEEIEREGNITRLPLTKTGYVRNYVRNVCFYGVPKGSHKKHNDEYRQYKALMRTLTLTPDEYNILHRAFAGGFTHAAARYSQKVVESVDSFDFTSSYPYVILSEMFPMGKGRKIENPGAGFSRYLDLYCCVFDLEIFNLQSKYQDENPISSSKCWVKEGVLENNGRVYSADHIITTVTNVDYKVFKRFYDWDKIRVANFWIYPKDYLPKSIIEAVLKLYEDKTTLKGVEGKEVEYLVSKGMLNSVYGMMVTNIVRELVLYDDDWAGSEKPVLDEAIIQYNESKKRFLFYPWGSPGIFVTAYARRNLLMGIRAMGDDYVYSDTDSIKCINVEKHMDYINGYNRKVLKKLKLAAKHYGLSFERYAPETIKGEKKLIGVWDWETKKGNYRKFKTLGAKRYFIEFADGSHSLTVSGVNKRTAVPWMEKTFGENIMAEFSTELVIPPEASGKLIHSYIDEPHEGYMIDYQGNRGYYCELSCVHLEAGSYSMNMAEQYADFLKGKYWIRMN